MALAGLKEKVQKRLLLQYQKSENLKGLVGVVADEIEKVSDAISTLSTIYSLDDSTGIALDIIGTFLEFPRQGESDDDYRILLKIRIGQLNTDTTIDDVLSIWELINNSTNIHLTEDFPASIDLFTGVELAQSVLDRMFPLLGDIVAAGVSVNMIAQFIFPQFILASESSGFGGLGFATLRTSGQNTSISAGKLVHVGGLFIAKGVVPTTTGEDGDNVHNNATGLTTKVSSVDSEDELTLITDRFPSAPTGYHIDGNDGGFLGKILAHK